MERESFENTEAAEILNREYVAIKVDREERPDIDAVYMEVCQMMTGSGGWPLTVLMTPDQKPFYAGTYFPLHSVYGRPGLVELLETVASQWKAGREKLLEAGDRVSAYLKEGTTGGRTGEPDNKLLLLAAGQMKESFDEKFGGFGNAPKFPTPHQLLFLLRMGEFTEEKKLLDMAEKTLIQMYRGGIYDHVGGGFSRYSTDREWLVPHFEKMLYDNALLVYVYSEAYRARKNPVFERAVRESVGYVLRELRDPAGGFYCAQDADSEGEEGKYYTFTPEEMLKLLGKEPGKQYCERFDITDRGNFEGKSIPNLLKEKDYEKEYRDLEEQKTRLLEYRRRRTRLHKDDKILASWNGMMIAALAKAAAVFGQESWLLAAVRAWNFVSEKMRDKGGRLFVRYRDKEAAGTGQLNDYAYLSWALIELYDCCYDANYLKEAAELAGRISELFEDKKGGGLYLYSSEAEQLIARPKDTYDGAVPSGNSVAGLVFTKLAALTAEKKWADARDRQLAFLAGEAGQYPMAAAFGLTAMAEVLYPSVEIIIVSSETKKQEQIRELLKNCPELNRTVLVKNRENKEELKETAPFVYEYPFIEEKTAVYVCTNGSCEKPILY